MFYLIAMVFVTTKGHTQSFWSDISISTQFSIAQLDKRIIDPRTYPLICTSTEKGWTTKGYGLTLHKAIWEQRRFESRIGLGYALNHRTFFRVIDPDFFNKDDTDKLEFLDDYKIHLIQLPMDISMHVWKIIDLTAELSAGFDIFRSVYTYKNNDFQRWTGSFYNPLKFALQLEYKLKWIPFVD